LKVELDANQLNLIVQVMNQATIKGEHSIAFGKLLERLAGNLEKEMTKNG